MPLIKQNSKAETKSGLRGGTGIAEMFVSPVVENRAFTMANRCELEPGASIGFHKHIDDEEVYAIVSGEGVYGYDEGETTAGPGDIFVTHTGMSHALRNTSSTEPLVFFAVMAKK